jgi:hypothetical protein
MAGFTSEFSQGTIHLRLIRGRDNHRTQSLASHFFTNCGSFYGLLWLFLWAFYVFDQVAHMASRRSGLPPAWGVHPIDREGFGDKT